MRRILFAALLLLGGLPARAQIVSPYATPRGGDCSVMLPYYGPQVLWIGRFAAGRGLDTSADRVFDDWRTANRCFFSQRECEMWLANLGQQFPNGPGYAYCMPASGATPGVRGPVKP